MDGRSPQARARHPQAPCVEIAVESPLWEGLDLQRLTQEAVDAALAEGGVAVAPGAELSTLFCDDAAIRVLNRDWRGFDKPTNVLSFPSVHGSEQLAEAARLGDLAVAQETCLAEARADGKTLEDHVRHLIVHGVLHLLGYDHQDDEEAEEMEAIERRALARIGVADPYAESEPAAHAEPKEPAR